MEELARAKASNLGHAYLFVLGGYEQVVHRTFVGVVPKPSKRGAKLPWRLCSSSPSPCRVNIRAMKLPSNVSLDWELGWSTCW